VIILTDQYLATSYETIPEFELLAVTIDRGELVSDAEANNPGYKRHAYTASGISPRAFPMQGKALVVTDSDEHNEAGHLIEDAETRRLMVAKRLRKLEGMKKEITPPLVQAIPNSEIKLVGWGSTYGAIKEATALLKADGIKTSLMQLGQVWPFPVEAVAAFLNDGKQAYTVEGNATAQLAHLIRAETGIKIAGSILKYDGRPFSPRYIANAVKKEVR